MMGWGYSRISFTHAWVASAALLVALLACKQGEDEKAAPEKEKETEVAAKTDCKSGEVSSCKCGDGSDGSRECDAKGSWQACECQAAPPPPQPPSPAEQVLAADGLPEEIPPPGSKPPTTAEWEALPKECTVRGSSALKCNTWMYREWLKVNCHRNHMGNPSSVELHAGGVQAFKFVRPSTQTSTVMQVVRSRRSTATYFWDRGRKKLVVDWPHGAPRPDLHFE